MGNMDGSQDPTHDQQLPRERGSLWHGGIRLLRLERKELRKDIDPDLIGSILDWTMDHFQDALLTEELDPGLFRRTAASQREPKRGSNSSWPC
jgi:hypothetical protein